MSSISLNISVFLVFFTFSTSTLIASFFSALTVFFSCFSQQNGQTFHSDLRDFSHLVQLFINSNSQYGQK